MSCRIFPINYRKLWQVGIRLNPWLKYRRVIDAFTSIHVINSTLFSTMLIAQFRMPYPSLAHGRFVKRREEKVDMGKREGDEFVAFQHLRSYRVYSPGSVPALNREVHSC